MTKGLLSKLLAVILVVTTVGCPTVVLANSEACTAAHTLEYGVKAPCTGLLITEDDARTALSCIKVELPSLRIDYESLKLKFDERETRYEALLSLEHTRVTRMQELLKEAAKIPRRQVSWYESPYFLISVGVIGGVVLTFSAVYAASELGK